VELFEFQDFLIGQIVSKTRLVIQEVGGLRGVIWLCRPASFAPRESPGAL